MPKGPADAAASVVALRAEIARQKEANQLLELRAELEKTRRANDELAKTIKGLPDKKKKDLKDKEKKEKKKKQKLAEKTSDKTKSSSKAAVHIERKKNEKAVSMKEMKPDVEVLSVYVGGLPYEETEESIREIMKARCGFEPKSVTMRTFEDGERFNGIAILSFADKTQIDAAVALDGTEYGGRSMKVRLDRVAARPAPPVRQAESLTVYAGNMPFSTKQEEIEALFTDQGCTITKTRYHTDPDSGDFKGYVHLEFADEDSLQYALALASIPFNGRELRISHSVTAKRKVHDDAAASPAAPKGAGTPNKRRRTTKTTSI